MYRLIQSIAHECRILSRRWQQIAFPSAFFALIMAVIAILAEPLSLPLATLYPVFLWASLLVSSLMYLQFLFALEYQEGILEQWLLEAETLPSKLYLRLFSSWALFFIPLLLLQPLISVAMQIPVALWGVNAFVQGTGLLALLAIGMLMSALTVGQGDNKLLLPLLIVPFCAPVLIFGTGAMHNAFLALSIKTPLLLLAGFAVILVAVIPSVTAFALRISLE